jgi:sulfatase modifying factor 1
MLPERLGWIIEAFEPEGDPWLLFQIARDLQAEGNLEGAATVYDRAFALAPKIEKIRQGRDEVLDRLEVREHGLVFRYIPAGPFLMGRRDGEPDEHPLHPVWLSPYWLTDTPVSWADYCRLLHWQPAPIGVPPGEDTDDRFLLLQYNKLRRQYCGLPVSESDGEEARQAAQPRYPGDGERWRYDLKPMVGVGWQEAEELTGRLSTYTIRYSLPTEAQWEKAARGGLIGARHAWGDELPSSDNCDFGNFHAFRIGQMRAFAPNGYGLYAMNGGVWEWTADWYDRDFYRDSLSHDPKGPETGQEKVLRGGCWADCAAVVTNTFRMSRPSRHWRNWREQGHGFGGQMTPTVGFRLCRTTEPRASV